MSGIASFITGAIEGRERRRTWDDQDKDRDWKKDRRGRQLVLDGQDDTRFGREQTEWGQKDEDRLSDNAWKDESRGNERGDWKEQDTLFGRTLTEHAQSDEDRTRRHKEEDYTFGRTLVTDKREDETRAVHQAAADAYGQAVATDNSVAPSVPGYAPPVAPGLAEAPAAAPVGRSLPGAQVPQTIAGQPDALAPTPVAPVEPQMGRLEAAAARAGAQPVASPVPVAEQGQPRSLVAPGMAPAAPAATSAPAQPAPAQPTMTQGADPLGAGAIAAAVSDEAQSQPAGKRLPRTAEETEAYVSQIVPPAVEEWRKTHVPKVIQSYIANGEYEKAEKFEAFVDSKQARAAVGHLMSGLAVVEQNPRLGLDYFAKTYNSEGYYDDGMSVDPAQSSITVDPQTGGISGTIAMRDDHTGQMTEVPFDGTDDLYRMAAARLAPESVFEQGMEQMKIASTTPEFRRATPEEAAAYGSPSGQFGPDGKFYPVNPPSGMTVETGPDGQVRVVQGAGAGTAAGKPFTEGQSKDIVFAVRAQGALDAFEPYADALTSRGERAAEGIPLGLARGAQSPKFQLAQQAGGEFLQAILRKDTGAAITEGEQALYGKTYLPQPGDSPEVLFYKRASRQRAVDALKAGMSPSQILAQEMALAEEGTAPAAQPTGTAEAPPAGPAASGQPAAAPATDDVSDDDLLNMYGG